MLSKPLSAVAASSSDHRLQEMDCFSGKVFETSMKEFELEFEMDRNGVEDFSVDDLFDFPENDDDDVAETEIFASDGGLEEAEPCGGVKFEDVARDGVGCGFSPTEISVPVADVAELEWLSFFVDDSFSEYTLEYSTVNHSDEKKKLEPQTVAPAGGFGILSFPRWLTKPRAKRTGNSGESWTRSSTLSDSTSSSSSTGSTSSPLTLKELKPRPKKRQKREIDGGALQSVRRCSHCGVQKTPQWRAGPEGEKTLCNACGVRYKSGRLCPEYRPACSPTFTPELHSNQHRKVMELRRKKEAVLSFLTGF